MKRWIAFVLSLSMALALSACGGSTDNTEETAAPKTTTTATQTEAPDTAESSPISATKEFTSDTGFNMDVSYVALTPDGQVIMHTRGDLAKAVGSEVVLTDGITNLYVEPFGNGGYYTILMIRNDGTVSAVNSTALLTGKTVEIMDKLGGYQDVIRIEPTQDPDAHTVNAVMGNGDAYPLDPYLK